MCLVFFVEEFIDCQEVRIYWKKNMIKNLYYCVCFYELDFYREGEVEMGLRVEVLLELDEVYQEMFFWGNFLNRVWSCQGYRMLERRGLGYCRRDNGIYKGVKVGFV